MRLKYYLKGIGVGLIIAALLMGIATRDSATMTDEEIKVRAKELGMVEQKTLADTIRPTEVPVQSQAPVTSPPKEVVEPVETKQPIENIPSQTEEPAKETETPVEETIEEPTPTENPTAEPANTEQPVITQETIIFEIYKGESSDSISKRLAEQGLVAEAIAYNNYLCNNGYDRKLNIGTYQLKIGMTEEEIAKIITRTR